MNDENGQTGILDDTAKTVKTAKQAASTVKGAVKTGKAVAGLAVGAGTMGIGTALMIAWDNRGLIFKIIIGVSVALIFMAVIAASLPMALFHWAVDAAANTADGNQQILSAYKSMSASMSEPADAEHTRLLKSITDDAASNGYILLNTSDSSSPSQSQASSSSEGSGGRVHYVISDNYKGVQSNDISLAVCCYSIAEGNDNKADPNQFSTEIKESISKFFTYTKTQSSDSSGKILVTYTIQYDETVSKSIFKLSDDQYNEALQLAVNMQTLMDELNGKDDDSTIQAGTGNNGMGVSDSLIKFIENHEGFSPTPYRGVDSWNQTIGYGHVIKSGENYTYLTQAQAEDLLKQDLSGFISSVDHEFQGTSLKQNQIDALVSLCYNFGPNIWDQINLTNDVKSNASMDVIKKDFESLEHVKDKVVLGLLRRRDAEYEMYEYGYYLSN